MATFSAKTSADAVVPVERARIWEALVDPELVGRLTPFVKKITADGDHWLWDMSGLDLLGVRVAPQFTELMTFEDQTRIEFHHDPPDGKSERAGVNGWYQLGDSSDARGGTDLSTHLQICLSAPLPRLSSPAVTAAMKGVMATMGVRFSKNLLDHLGVRSKAV